MRELVIHTSRRYQLLDITDILQREIEDKQIYEGILFVFCLHTTASIFITENEEGLKQDWIDFFKKITSGINYQHDHLDGNAPSHIFAGMLGQERTIPIKNGKLLLGTWQRVFLAEFDGPRERKIILKFIKN